MAHRNGRGRVRPSSPGCTKRDGERGGYSRRDFLGVAGGMAAASLLAGCGSGGDGGSGGGVVVNPPDGLVDAPRPELASTLAGRVNQYSQAVQNSAEAWTGSSTTLAEAQAFFEANQSSRQALSSESYYQSLYHGMVTARQSYERAINTMLAIDDKAYLTDRMYADGEAPDGEQLLRNPYWDAAMYERFLRTTRVMGTVLREYQTSDILRLREQAMGISNETNRKIAYGFLAYTYNRWVQDTMGNLGMAVNPNWLLVDKDPITIAEVDQQLNRLPDILPLLPLGAGYRPAAANRSSQLSDLDLAGKTAETTLKPFAVEVAEVAGHVNDLNRPSEWLKQPQTIVDTAKLNAAVTGGRVLADAAKGAGKNIVGNVISDVVRAHWGNAAGTIANCGFSLMDGTLTTARFAAAAIGSSATVVGAIGFGALAVISAVDLANKFRQCNEDLARALEPDLNEIQDTHLPPSGEMPPPRQIPSRPVPSGKEYDQMSSWERMTFQAQQEAFNQAVSDQAVKQTAVAGPQPTTAGAPAAANPQPNPARRLLCGLATGSSARQLDLPRTYDNLQSAATGLFAEFLGRSGGFTKAQQTGLGVSYFRSSYAVMVERSAGEDSAAAPQYGSAMLVCTAVGAAPKRNLQPVDLAIMEAFPALPPLGEFASEVDVNVS